VTGRRAWAGRWADRQLGGDARSGRWARARMRTARYRYLRANLLRLTVWAAAMLVPVVVAAALTPSPFLRGLLLGGGSVGVLGALWLWVVQVTGTATLAMGELAEQCTGSELRKLRRTGWHVVNHITLTGGDTDHVLLGPGGCFAVETKWSSEPWPLDRPDERISRATAQAAGNARRLGLWQPFRAAGIRVQPVVMLWGGAASAAPEHEAVRTLDGTVIVLGPHARRWRDQLPTAGLTESQVHAGWDALRQLAAQRDAYEQRTDPVPPALSDLAARALFTVVAAAAGFLAVTQVLTHTSSILWALAAAGLLVPPALALTRLRPLRTLAWGWISGVAATGTALLAALILDALA
jgi:hypothetical protein